MFLSGRFCFISHLSLSVSDCVEFWSEGGLKTTTVKWCGATGNVVWGGENQKPQQKCCDKHLKAIQRAPFFPRTPSLPPCLHLSSYVFASCSMPFLTPLLNDFFFFFPSILHKGLVQFCHYSYYCWWLQTKSWLLSSGVIGNCRCERAH